jgi:hypothetical protein
MKGALNMRTIEEIRAELSQYKKYEDVPKELRKEYNKISLQMIQQEECEIYRRYEITKDIPLDRLQEICNAERDGRCVVLPCKVGDTIYVTIGHFNKKITESKAVKVWFNGFDYRVVCDGIGELTFGKSVFLTKEAAEQALKGGAE